MNYFFSTTFNARLFKEYAHKFINTYLKTNQEIPLICYVDDDFNYPKSKKITYKRLDLMMPNLIEFKERHNDIILDLEYEAYSDKKFLQNAVRFSHKVFAQVHSSYSEKKFMYVDADNIFKKNITKNIFDKFIPNNIFLTCYGRPNYVETGIIGFNSTKKDLNKIFFDKYLSYYTKDKIFESKFKTDSQALDGTRQEMKIIPGYREIDRGDGLDGHVIYRDKFIFKYLDHRKGKRKYKKIINDNFSKKQNQNNKISFFKKIKVQLKNYIFKLIYS